MGILGNVLKLLRLKFFKPRQDSLNNVTNEIQCIMNIDVGTDMENTLDNLMINEDIDGITRTEFLALIKKEYWLAERPNVPKVDAELRLS
ncbi:hypothetical protein KPH14_001386 [Odynerus spinipes]|uniref:Uncharacterized protein n=1 Tax=Odynerus spinipes TaxID=1348599 RepID=A0AAD9REJ1_9HYME|nr:hypothetical protein KPH14_001386 [Odynerus spinipes]